MLLVPPLSLSIIFALALAVAMTVVGITLLFTHERTQEQFDQWVDFSFSGATLRQALTYYRVIGISMVVFYVLFMINCLLLQWDGHQILPTALSPPGQAHSQ